MGELDRRAIAEAFKAQQKWLGWTKKRVADVSGYSPRTMDDITAAKSSVSTTVLAAVSRAMWGDDHADALERVGRGRPPVDEQPDLAERMDRLEGRMDEVVELLERLLGDVGREGPPQ